MSRSRSSRCKALKQGTLAAYLKATRGYACANGESLLDSVAKIVADKTGSEWNGCGAREFVERHVEHVRSIVNAAPKRRDGKVKSAPTEAPFELPTSAEKAASYAASDKFLESYEWRRVRMVALKKYGPRCQCCGATPATGAVMNVDHIKPRRLFPELALDVDNLQLLCHVCNHGKGNWDMTDWRKDSAATT